MARLAELIVAFAMVLQAAPLRAEEANAPVSVVLRWSAVPGAAAYELQVGSDPSFDRLEVEARTKLPGYRWSAIPQIRYHWRVRSIDDAGRFGPWSEVRTIEPALGGPALLEPADGAQMVLGGEHAAVTLRCAPSRLLGGYTIEVARNATFSEVTASWKSNECRARFELPGPGIYHWRVTGTTLLGKPGPPSETRTLVIVLGAPHPTGPADGAVFPFGPVTLRWEGIRAITQYRTHVAGEPPAQDQDTIATGPTAVFSPPRSGSYTWSVRALDARGAGPASARRTFVVRAAPVPAAPGGLAPGGGAIVGDGDPAAPVPLAWEPVEAARSYEVQVTPASALDGAPMQPAADRTLQGLALPEGTITWRVRGLNAEGVAGAWSEPATFFHGRPPTVRAVTVRTTPPVGMARQPDRLFVGLGAGLVTNFHGLASPAITADLTWRTPLLRDRLRLTARAGYHGTSAAIPLPGGASTQASAQGVPLALLALYEVPLEVVSLHAGAGLAGEITSTSVGESSSLSLAPGVQLLVGASRALGPGQVFLDVGAGASFLDSALVKLGAVRFTLLPGYRIPL